MEDNCMDVISGFICAIENIKRERLDLNKSRSKKRRKSRKKTTGIYEWGNVSVNIIEGCSHGCLYCFAKAASSRREYKARKYATENRKSISINDWNCEKIKQNVSFTKALNDDGEYILCHSSHDIIPQYVDLSINCISKLLNYGKKVMIITKPHLICIKKICNRFNNYKDKILFRFTITSDNDNILRFWEPNAPLFDERLSCLLYAYNNGFKTSVVVEPILDTINNTIKHVDNLLPYVTHSLYLGKPNNFRANIKLNGVMTPTIERKIRELEKWHCDSEILRLYNRYCYNKKVVWMRTIRRVIQ